MYVCKIIPKDLKLVESRLHRVAVRLLPILPVGLLFDLTLGLSKKQKPADIVTNPWSWARILHYTNVNHSVSYSVASVRLPWAFGGFCYSFNQSVFNLLLYLQYASARFAFPIGWPPVWGAQEPSWLSGFELNHCRRFRISLSKDRSNGPKPSNRTVQLRLCCLELGRKMVVVKMVLSVEEYSKG